MAKHTQTIRRQKPTNCLNVFDHFVGLALKELELFLLCLTYTMIKADFLIMEGKPGFSLDMP